MKPSTALSLARPAARAERGRQVLIAGSSAAAGALLIAAAHIPRLPAEEAAAGAGLARYVSEPGLRPGVTIATLLLVVPVLALAVQALRVGSVARDRRMASLRLAGATPGEVRAIAAAEAGGAAAVGGLLAGPAYVVLWMLAGALPPAGARMLDVPGALDAIAWAALVPLAGLAGALAGGLIGRRAMVEPLGVRRRAPSPVPGRASFAVLLAGGALLAAGIVVVPLLVTRDVARVALAPAVVGLLLVAFAGGPRFVLGCAGVLGRRPGVAALLASRRLVADTGSAGRVAGVLLVCGVALGVEGFAIAEQIVADGFGEDAGFYLAGYGMAALAMVVAAGVALLTLLVGAADGMLDARRPLATLAALGVDEPMLLRVLARQLSATAVPAVVAGSICGVLATAALVAASGGEHWLDEAARALLLGGGMAVATGLLLGAAAVLAARLLRPLVRAAIDPENLRVA